MPSLASLLIKETKAAIYAKGLEIAQAIGLPVTSWQAGDPTRSLLYLESEVLAALEDVVVGYIASGFLDYATGVWLKVLAKQVFNVDVPSATYATATVRLTNASGFLYVLSPGDVTLKSSINGKTYHNTTGGTLNPGPGTTLDLVFEADEAGSASSAGVGEIDTVVTGQIGVTCSNALAAVGIDEQDESVTRQQCRDKLGSLSPNGPKDAYSYVARNSTLTGNSETTRVRVFSSSTTGDVYVYLAGAAGAVTSPARAAVETAILNWATPLCITPHVLAASNVVVPVTYTLYLYKSANRTTGDITAAVQDALEQAFASRPIGGDIIPPATTGKLYVSYIESVIRGVFPDDCFRVVVSAPGGDTALANNEVATLGAVTPTVVLV